MRDTEIKEQLKGTGAVEFKWLTSARASVRESLEQRALENNTLAVTEAILDPKKQAQLKTIVKMTPSTRKAIMLSAVLAGQGTKVAAATDEDVAPSGY